MNAMAHVLNTEEVTTFHRDGYVIVKNFFSKEEIEKLYGIAVSDTVMRSNALDLNDQTGKKTKLTLWFNPGEDVYSMLIRSNRMVASAAKLLDSDSPVCHFHSKLMQKEPKVGGAWEWHQDYGYWYKNQFLYPDQLVSVMVAITEANRQNGCLQVLKGSHKMGRIEHTFAGEQQGADQPSVDEAMKTFERVYVELEPGDALFFHSNLLHMSEANLSDRPRWSLISCYNMSYNKPFREKNTSCITPVNVVADNILLSTSAKSLGTGTDFLSKEKEITLNVK